ncbi:MAG: uroporphyrinogen decarboxylase [Chlamydiae bacterium]|nr:uroporphyrinogen decarboxylase [Chlamydiota bacterium]
MNDLLLRVLKGQHTERHPVWLMRQAGRYMPQYQNMRAKHSLWRLFHDPKLAAEVTMLPIHLLDVDAAILFSDILVLAEAFDRKIVFPDHGGPFVSPFVETLEDLKSIRFSDLERKLSYVAETISIIKPQLKVPLFGFSAAPFTLASYMIEGASRSSFAKTKTFMSEHPNDFCSFLQKLADACIEYTKMQVHAGADAIQIFDSWANILSLDEFKKFCLPYWKMIKLGLKDLGVPVIFFCRDSHRFIEEIASIDPIAISIDEKGNMAEIRKILGDNIILQGNLCAQFLRDASRDMVIEETKKILISLHGQKGLIMNLGHGVLPLTPMENVRVFVQTVKEFKV